MIPAMLTKLNLATGPPFISRYKIGKTARNELSALSAGPPRTPPICFPLNKWDAALPAPAHRRSVIFAI
jgi:hypothetical protein